MGRKVKKVWRWGKVIWEFESEYNGRYGMGFRVVVGVVGWCL